MSATYSAHSVSSLPSLLSQKAPSCSVYEQWKRTAAKLGDVQKLFKGAGIALNAFLLAPLSSGLSKAFTKSGSNLKEIRSLFVFPRFISSTVKLHKEAGQLHQKISKSRGPIWESQAIGMQTLSVTALSAGTVSNAAKVGTRLFEMSEGVLGGVGLFSSFLGVFSSSLKSVRSGVYLKNLFAEKPHSEQQSQRIETKKKVLSIKLVSNITKVASHCMAIAAFFTSAVFCPYFLIAMTTFSFGLSLASRVYKQMANPPPFSRVATLYY